MLGSEGSEGLVEVGFARWSQKLCTCAPAAAARDTAKRSSSCSRDSQSSTSLHVSTPPSVGRSYRIKTPWHAAKPRLGSPELRLRH